MARLDFATQSATDGGEIVGGADGLYQLGLMYSSGREVEVDLVAAHKWFNLAALRGNEDAKRYRMELAHEMTKRQIAEAQRNAREWLKQH